MSTRLKTSTSEEILRSVPLPRRTISYTPVPNELIFDILHDKMNEYGLSVKQSDLTMSTNGKRFIGLYDIESQDSELGYRIGFRNSYDGSMSFGMGVGSVVWLCSNGMVHGDIAEKRIHRGNADKDVEEIIKIGLERYQIQHDENLKIKENLKEIYCDTNDIYKIVGKICVGGIMNGNEINRFKNEITNSKLFDNLTLHPEGLHAWDLYNHSTEVLKKSSFSSYFDKHNQVHELFLNEFSL
jgi:hypothetical protein